ncbi:MAG: T9SS type A sorting domain-containing protein [Bacteroidota bacterium]
MNRILMLAALTLAVGFRLLHAQTLQHPWRVVDQGGGTSTGSGGLMLQTSMGQPAVQRMTPGLVLESGYIPGLRMLGGSATSLTMAVHQGWNMISVPLRVADYAKISVFPTAISPAFMFSNGYVQKDTLEDGCGYWVKFEDPESLNVGGTSIMHDSIDVAAGWNMIGMISYPVLTAEVVAVPPCSVLSLYYGYRQPGGYYDEDTLRPGRAYWAKVAQAGKLVLPSGSVLSAGLRPAFPVSAQHEAEKTTGLRLRVRDAAGNERTVQILPEESGLDPARAELPPPPPAGIMDVRFGSQRAVELYSPGGGTRTVPLSIESASYPLVIEWEKESLQAECDIVVHSGVERVQRMEGSGTLVMERPGIIHINLKAKSEPSLPAEFALHQNYPNPFNPKARIKYDLPAKAHVGIVVFDILGKQVAVLRNDIEDAGYRSVEFDGSGLASGVYFYRMDVRTVADGRAGSSSFVKKMLLQK